MVELGNFVSERREARAAAPKSLDACLERANDTSFLTLAIDTWYCETQFADLWTRGGPTMLEDNRSKVAQYFDYLDPRQDRDDLGFTDETTRDTNGLAGGGKLSRLFNDFPRYSGSFALVSGQVRRLTKLAADEAAWTDWVVQLGTRRQAGILIYARFSKPSAWTPPPENKCTVGIIEGLPIARGYTETVGGPGTQELIYELATSFACFSARQVADATERFRRDPKLKPYFDRGRDPNAW
jgi:hypothetical protein